MTKVRKAELSPEEQKFLRYLAMYRGLYVSTNRIAKKFRMDPRTVKSYLQQLEKKNLVKKKKIKKKKTRVKTKRVEFEYDTKLLLWAYKLR